MNGLEISLILFVLSWSFKTFWDRYKVRSVAYIVHVQGRTESDETIDLAVSLYEDEPMLKWQEKLERAYSIREARLKYQNDRVLAMMAEADKKEE